MENYTKDTFKHNVPLVQSAVKTVKETIVCTKDIRIIFPERYINQGLAFMGSIVKVVNIFAIIDDKNNYSTTICPAYIELIPSNITDITVDGVNYKCLHFEKDSVICGNINLVRNTDFLYNLFDEFFIKGKVPWFLSYDNKSDILLESMKYANSRIGNNPVAYEILAAIISRSSDDKTQYYRHKIKDNKGKVPMINIGLNNIYYSFDNTASKIIGGYYGPGVTAAVITKEKKTTVMADVLRA